MFDREGDAMSIVSSRAPSLIMAEGQSMQDYYAQQQQQAQRLASGSSIDQRILSRASSFEAEYGWSGSKGGVSNKASEPRYRVSSSGKLVSVDAAGASDILNADSAPPGPLAANAAAHPDGVLAPARPGLRSARSDGGKASAKPMYRPAFAPSTELPPSSDEEDLDRVIQHDLPKSRPLKPRASLKQKLGSVLARVSSRKRTASPSPPLPSTEELENDKDADGVEKDYVNVKQADGVPTLPRRSGGLRKSATTATPRRPDLGRAHTSYASPTSATFEGGATATKMASLPAVAFDDNAIRTSEGGTYSGGVVELARKLSRRATTGGAASSATGARARMIAEERAREAIIRDKAAAEELLRNLATIPLHKAPRSANVPNAKPLSSFAPRPALRTSADKSSLANAPRYAYYQRQIKDYDGPSRDVGRSKTLNGSKAPHSRSKSDQSITSQSPLLATNSSTMSPGSTSIRTSTSEAHTIGEEGEDIPPVPPLPQLDSDAPNTFNWEKFRNPSNRTLTGKASNGDAALPKTP